MPAETKDFPLDELKLDGAGDRGPGGFAGYVAVYGNVDHGRDRMARGACADTKALLDSAYLFYGHDYKRFPIGMIREARDEPKGLYIAGPFHSTAEAQDARTVVRERAEAGLKMGLSVGYDPDEWAYEQDADGGPVRVLKKITVREGSLVPFPMNERAQLDEVKSAAEPDEGKPFEGTHSCRLRDPGAFQDGSFRTMSRRHDGKPYGVIVGRLKGEDTLTEQALRYRVEDGWTAAQARSHCSAHDGKLFEPAKSRRITELPEQLLEQAAELIAEAKEGRAISSARRERIAHRLGRIKEELADLEELLRETEPPAKQGSRAAGGMDRTRFEFARIEARLRATGVRL